MVEDELTRLVKFETVIVAGEIELPESEDLATGPEVGLDAEEKNIGDSSELADPKADKELGPDNPGVPKTEGEAPSSIAMLVSLLAQSHPGSQQ